MFRSSVENKSYKPIPIETYFWIFHHLSKKKVYTGTVGVSLMLICLDNIVIEVIKVIQVMVLSTLILYVPHFALMIHSPLPLLPCSTWNQHWRNKSSPGNGYISPTIAGIFESMIFRYKILGFVLWRLVSLESSFPEKKQATNSIDTSHFYLCHLYLHCFHVSNWTSSFGFFRGTS